MRESPTAKPSFILLNQNYSTNTPGGFTGYAASHWNDPSPNTCAVRLAYALWRTDNSFFKDVRANAEWYGLPVRANELAHILTKKLGRGQLVGSAGGIANRTGIIFFDTIRGYAGSGHISLWDGSQVVDGGDYFSVSPRVYFWLLP